MSVKQRIILCVSITFVVIISLDIFKEKYEGQILQYQYTISNINNDRLNNYNLIHMPADKRIEAFSYNLGLKPGKYVVGKDVNMVTGWYSFINKSPDKVKVNINGIDYELFPEYKAELGNTTLELYINQGDIITTTGELSVNKAKIYS